MERRTKLHSSRRYRLLVPGLQQSFNMASDTAYETIFGGPFTTQECRRQGKFGLPNGDLAVV
jgi:hypothetical protein